MSKLTELLDELCPDGVEYRPLGQLGKRNKGMVITASRMKELHQEGGEVRIFAGGHTIADVDRDDLPGAAVIDVPSIIVKSRGNIGFEYHTKPFTHKNELWSYTLDDPDVDQKFIFYYLQSQVGYFQLKAKSGKLPQIGVRDTDHFSIPVPPLEVQQEIVRVLDAFTDLEQSLVSELELRKKQFEEYLSEVLQTSNSGRKSATLGDIGSVRMCKRIMKHQTSPVGDVPFFKIGSFGGQPDAYIPRELFEEYRSKYSFPRVGEILISAAGTIGRTVKYDGEAAYFQDSNIVWLENDETEVTNDYLYYWYKVVNWTTDSGTIKRLYNKNLLAAGISYPNKAGQEEIVAKLNTFESLIQSIEQEINLRRTQYEFYRNELLSFTPKED